MDAFGKLIGFVASVVVFLWLCVYGIPILIGAIFGGEVGAIFAIALVTIGVGSILRGRR